MTHRRLVSLFAILGCAGCVGDIGAVDGPGGQALCQEAPPTSAAPLRRLSRAQYGTVLNDVIERWAPGLGAPVLAAPAVATALGLLREDLRVTRTQSKHGGFRRLDQDVGQDQVDASLAIAKAIGTELTSSMDRIGQMLGACSTDADASNDSDCVRGFITRAGRAAHRRPLDSDDVDFYMTVYDAQGIDPAGLADVITVLLTNPYFFYQLEHGGEAIDEGAQRYALTGDELADRLSLQFWNSIPDDTLLALADSGRILTDDGFAEALAHVLASPRTTQIYGEFFREFFSAEDLVEIDQFKGTPLFDAFRGSYDPTGDTREHMIDELVRLTTYYATKPDGTFADLFLTKKSFATTDDVASLYGVAPWSGEGEPPDMPDPQRVGLLTHAAMLATGSATTRPIIKGAFIRTALLCDVLSPPPAAAMQVAQDEGAKLDPVMTTRARTTAITSRSDCAGCHAQTINPLGFAFEGFDALGRARTTERIFDQSGTLLGELPVDSSTVPYLVPADSTPVSGPADFAPLLLSSRKAQACMAAKYYAFTFAQTDSAQQDQCVLDTIKNGFLEGKPMQTVLGDLARSQAFRQRVFD